MPEGPGDRRKRTGGGIRAAVDQPDGCYEYQGSDYDIHQGWEEEN